MTLSEMLRNAKDKYVWFTGGLFGHRLGKPQCCALGALAMECDMPYQDTIYSYEAADHITAKTGIDMFQTIVAPTGHEEPLYAAIYIMNDELHMKYTQIADWLEERGL